MPFGLQLYSTSVQAQIPNLTPQLVEKLRSAFGDEYPNVQPLPTGILIHNEKEGRSLLIGPQQSVVGQKGTPVVPDFAAHQKILRKLSGICEWKTPLRFGYQMIGFLPVGDARATSLEEFTSVSSATLKERLPEAFAAALRFFIEHEGLRGELRLEPFEPDERFLALTLEAATKEPISFKEIPTHGEGLLNQLVQSWVPFMETTFTGE